MSCHSFSYVSVSQAMVDSQVFGLMSTEDVSTPSHHPRALDFITNAGARRFRRNSGGIGWPMPTASTAVSGIGHVSGLRLGSTGTAITDRPPGPDAGLRGAALQ